MYNPSKEKLASKMTHIEEDHKHFRRRRQRVQVKRCPTNCTTILFVNLLFIISLIKLAQAQAQQNYLIPGHNMENLRISELKQVGSIVHQLKAVDKANENRNFTYHMTGDIFRVDELTGEVTLMKPLDRERQAQINTVVNILDSNSEPIESRSRRIIVEDVDDSWPVFAPHRSFVGLNQGVYVYQTEVSELASNGTTVLSEMLVTDADVGLNAEITFECRSKQSTNQACDVFNVEWRRLNQGRYSVSIKTRTVLDFERVQSYRLALVARGKQPSELKGVPLETEAMITINVLNVQDESPVFVNAPYALSMPEGLRRGTRLLSLIVQDGDLAPQRDLSIIVVPGPFSDHFQLTNDPESGKLWYLETNATLDRESLQAADDGGGGGASMFSISLLAVELDDSNRPIASESEIYAAMRESSAHSKGTMKREEVTVMVLDVPDTAPRFVQASNGQPIANNLLILNVSESLISGATVPNLDLAVQDLDQGINSRFKLTLTDADIGPKASEAFALESELIYGRSEIVLNVKNSSLIDYEEPQLRSYRFTLVASKSSDTGEMLVQMLELQLNIVDANDNVPEFDRDQYIVEVPEGSLPGRVVATIRARDRDSGAYGRVDYLLRGPGASKFKLVSNEGKILVNDCGQPCLDYEAQSSFSLTYEARDGAGQTSNVSVIINVQDVNDHAPKFTESVYKRELISDNLSSKQNYISPQLIVRAKDADGPTQGRNNITYRIRSSNLTGLEVEPSSGLVYLSQPFDLDQVITSSLGSPSSASPSGTGGGGASSSRRPSDGKIVFAAEVIADDNGSPAQQSTATILLVVKGNRDGAPQFRQDTYLAYVRENQPPGKPFFQVQAIDPDDKDSQLRYSLGYDLNDLVNIDPLSGELSFKSQVDADDFKGSGPYNVTVYATDNGRPYPLTASAMVSVVIQDVNDKAPVFERPQEYTATLAQGLTRPGDVVLQVQARDDDQNAKLNYSIIEDRLTIRDRSGQVFTLDQVANSTTGYMSHMTKLDRLKLVNDLRRLFSINKQTGQLVLRGEPDYSFLASVSLVVRVVDLNQEGFSPKGQLIQESFVECHLELQSHIDKSPIFAPPWSIDSRDYNVTILEELPLGTQIFSLLAKDPITNTRVDMYEKVFESDPRDYFRVDRSTGIVTVNRRIDYEEQPQQAANGSNRKQNLLTLSVKALTNEALFSVANLNIRLVDLNDNSPVFRNSSYQASVSESLAPSQEILTVTADDRDSNEYGQVYYALSPGHTSDLFSIHPRRGIITLKKGAKLDRDTEPSHFLIVSASDCNDTSKSVSLDQQQQQQPTGGDVGSGCRRATVSVDITVTDENDNDPVFINVNKRGEYEATTSETVSVMSVITQVQATDLDEGPNGQVQYEIVKSDDQVSKLFQIDPDGIISAVSSLSGLGRPTPYRLTIRAYDQGKTASRQSFATLLLTIGDVVSNDGVPRFVRPRRDEVISLSESVGPSTFVYQVQAVDPDEDSNGKLLYKFLQPSDTFEIDPFDGVIKTHNRLNYPLDRELVPNYTLIIVAQDLGSPPKQAQQVLTIEITDINDNEPYFERQVDDPPLVLFVEEELPKDSLVGSIQAIDKDIGQNALISYEITEGNHNNLFRLNWDHPLVGSINSTSDSSIGSMVGNNPCRIYSTGRLDRETRDSYTLTVRATSKSRNQFIHSRDPLGGRNNLLNQYNASDLSKLRVTIKLVDINDNRPVFVQQHPKSVVDSSADVYTQLMELQAVDLDSSGSEIQYSIVEALYYSDSRLGGGWQAHDNERHQSSRYSSIEGANPVSMRHVFDIDSRTGILRNSISLRPYIDGYFEVYVKADSGQPLDLTSDSNKCYDSQPNSTSSMPLSLSSSNNLPPGSDIVENCFVAVTKAVVFVTRQRETFRFVFDKTKLNDRLDEFKEKVQQALEDIMFEPAASGQVQASLGDPRTPSMDQPHPATARAEKVYLNTFQTDFYEREDGSLDFSTITSCSQLLKFDDRSRQAIDHSDASSSLVPNQVVNYDEVLGLMKTLNSTQIQQQQLSRQQQQLQQRISPSLFSQYGLVKIERCMPDKTMYKMTLPERLALYFASLIALVSILLAFIVSRMRKSYERNLKLLQRSKYQYMGPYA